MSQFCRAKLVSLPKGGDNQCREPSAKKRERATVKRRVRKKLYDSVTMTLIGLRKRRLLFIQVVMATLISWFASAVNL
ncbi:MAG: hypothetical protein RMK94_02275 [Armatimonadota bacterium]|nr:hypothetical protein [Armatimonadota bacterium]